MIDHRINQERLIRAVVPGLRVYDADGHLVGTVEMVDCRGGRMRVQTNPFLEDPLMIPLALVSGVDSRQLFLARVEADLGLTP